MILLMMGCAWGEQPEPKVAPKIIEETIPLTLKGTTVVAEVADDDAERAHGLMGRESLEPDHGMLFVYPREGPRSFWMKNTPLPLSIAFMDAQGRVVRIADMTPLELTAVRSIRPAMYALEMPQGWFDLRGINAGDKVEGLPGASNE